MADKKLSATTSQASVADTDELAGLKAGAPDATKNGRWLMSVLRTYFQTGMATSSSVSAAVSAHEAAADPHTGYQKESEKGAANGYAPLGADSIVPNANLPATVNLSGLSVFSPLDANTRFLCWDSTGTTYGYTTGAAIQAAYGGGGGVIPTLSSPVFSSVGSTTATVGATTDTPSGSIYFSVSTNATETAAVIKAGTGQAYYTGAVTVTSSGAKTASASGLTGNTNHYGHSVHTGSGGDSNVVHTSVFLTKPGQVAAPTLSSPASGTLRASWSAPTGGAASYNMVYGTDAGLAGATTVTGVTSANDVTGLSTGSYYCRIDSVNATGTTQGAIAGPQSVTGGVYDAAHLYVYAKKGTGQINSSGLSAWNDSSGNGRNLDSINGVKATINGDGTVTFNKNGSLLHSFASSVPGPYTVYLRFKINSRDATDQRRIHSLGFGNAFGYRATSIDNTQLLLGTGPGSLTSPGAVDLVGTWWSVGCVNDGSTQKGKFSGQALSGDLGFVGNAAWLEIGGSAGGSFGDVTYAEIRFYNVAHTNADMNAVLAELDLL